MGWVISHEKSFSVPRSQAGSRSIMKPSLLIVAALVSSLPLGASLGGEGAAPSSHFVFDDQFPGDILIHQVRVPKDGEAMCTYYETLGWQGKAGGYAGIQSHPRDHNFIFSIWDHPDHAGPIEAVYRGPGTETEKFGGEGTGLKSWNFELGWDTGVWYTLVSRCWAVAGDHTQYGFWARSGKTEEWTHLVTMDVAAKEAYFEGGTDAFLEDWLETGKEVRTTNLRGGWKRKLDGKWHPFGGGRYSVNAWDLEPGKRSFEFKTAWNGGVAQDETGKYYFMTAGGKKTKPTTENPSQHAIRRAEKAPEYPPIRIESAKAKQDAPGRYLVTWEVDPKTLPPFSHTIVAFTDPFGKGKPLVEVTTIEPHAREAELTLPDAIAGTRVYLRLRCRDILDNEVEFDLSR